MQILDFFPLKIINLKDFKWHFICAQGVFYKQGAVMPIGPVLRSTTGIKIESNDPGSRKVTIKRARALCSHYQAIKSVIRSVYISACPYNIRVR